MPAKSEETFLDVAGQRVRVSSPDKVFFSKRGETKMDTIEHYLRLEEPVMRALGGRPTLLQRFPNGASGKSFFQKRVPKNPPDWLVTTTVATVNGTTSEALVIADMAHVVWAVNLGVLGFHPWPFLAEDPDYADELRIDLDPQPGTKFPQVRETALELKTLLDELGLRSYPKTTGSKGMHVHVRLAHRWNSTEVRSAAVAVARELERRRPDLITAAWWKEERGERIFVDFNQNAPHKTVFGAWSVRARVGAQVSTPLSWDAVADADPEILTMESLPQYVADHGDPWESIDDEPQVIDELVGWFNRDLDAGLMDAPWPPVYPKQPHEPPRVAPSRARS